MKQIHVERLDGVEYTFWADEKKKREEFYLSLGQKGILGHLEKDFYMKEIKKLGGGKKSEKDKKQILSHDQVKKFRKYRSLQA